MKTLTIITARGGSKGIPGKNIKPLLGKPLIGWTIEQAKESENGKNIFVSTDDPGIALVAESFGIKVPFLRPAHLARDTSPSIDSLLHVIEQYEEKNEFFDFIILLEPTSPLRDSRDIDKALQILEDHPEAESIVGVSKVEGAHPAFLVKKSASGMLLPFTDEFKVMRRQDLDELYFFEGSLYISRTSALKEKKTFYHEKTLPYVVPKWKSFEIDDPEDFLIIESLMQAKLNGILK
jgi:CMP-N,N'-diacetyllegionaminic acid synthase